MKANKTFYPFFPSFVEVLKKDLGKKVNIQNEKQGNFNRIILQKKVYETHLTYNAHTQLYGS